jgi:hypothetical protein
MIRDKILYHKEKHKYNIYFKIIYGFVLYFFIVFVKDRFVSDKKLITFL